MAFTLSSSLVYASESKETDLVLKTPTFKQSIRNNAHQISSTLSLVGCAYAIKNCDDALIKSCALVLSPLLALSTTFASRSNTLLKQNRADPQQLLILRIITLGSLVYCFPLYNYWTQDNNSLLSCVTALVSGLGIIRNTLGLPGTLTRALRFI